MRKQKQQSGCKFRKRKEETVSELRAHERASASLRQHANRNGQVAQLNSAEPSRSLNYRREREGGEGGSGVGGGGGGGGGVGGTEGEDRVVSLASIYSDSGVRFAAHSRAHARDSRIPGKARKTRRSCS